MGSPQTISDEWDIKQRAISYFTQFVYILGREFGDKIATIIESSEKRSLFGIKERQIQEKAEKIVVELWDTANIGESDVLPLNTSWKKSMDEIEMNEFGSAFGVTGTMSIKSNQFETNSGVVSETPIKEIASTKQCNFNIMSNLVKKYIVQLIELLNLDFLIIIIDEWMALKETQVEFAELLKRCFFNSDRIGVKIGTDPYQARLNNGASTGSFRGIEIGADMFVAFNLDRALLDEEQLIDFYKALLFKRLNYFEPEISNFFGTVDNDGPNNLCMTIFQDNRAFRELVLASSGIPREFLIIFDQCCKVINCQLETKKLTASLIQDTSRSDSITNKIGAVADGSIADEVLFKAIKPVVEKNKSRIILIKKNDNVLLNMIETLLRARILNEYPEVRLDIEIRALYKAYILSYGVYLDWERSLDQSLKRSDIKEDFLPYIDSTKVEQYELDKKTLSIIDKEQVLCPHCDEFFSVKQRPYEKKGLCPYCFEFVGKEKNKIY
jgi:uncharacterized CHY-type Zn-finger protein